MDKARVTVPRVPRGTPPNGIRVLTKVPTLASACSLEKVPTSVHLPTTPPPPLDARAIRIGRGHYKETGSWTQTAGGANEKIAGRRRELHPPAMHRGQDQARRRWP